MPHLAFGTLNERSKTMIVSVRSRLFCSISNGIPHASSCGLLAVRKHLPKLFLSPLRTPRLCGVQLQTLAKHVKPGSTPAEPAVDASMSKVLKALELLSLASSIGLQGYALLMTIRQDAHRAEVCKDEPHHAEAVAPSMQHTYTQPTRLSHFAVVALILTYFLGLLHRMCYRSR